MKRRTLHRQRGVAVVTALLLTTLAITIVASLFWQQQVQVRSMENQRLQLQTKWILRGALDWARLILREDGLTSQQDFLGEPWSVKLAETRLDDYIERDRNDGDATDAALSGYIADAQARYNLRNLASNGVVQDAQKAVFRRLLANLNLRPELADATAEAIAADRPMVRQEQNPPNPPAPRPSGPRPLRLLQVEDLLAVPGYTPEIVQALRDYVVLLPDDPTKVNVNTAPAVVLAAVVPNLSLPEAQAAVAGRERAFFQSVPDFANRINKPEAGQAPGIDIKSGYFFVYGRVKLDRASLQTLALLARDAVSNVTVVWVREL